MFRSLIRRKHKLSPYDKMALSLFDRAFYLKKYKDVAQSDIDPFLHYCKFGWQEGRDPNSEFSTTLYLEANPDLVEKGVNPLAHYAENNQEQKQVPQPAISNSSGDAEQSGQPHIEMAVSSIDSAQKDSPFSKETIRVVPPNGEDLALMIGHFDDEFYLDQFPEILSMGIPPAKHYLTIGWLMGLDPSPEFSTSYYLRHNKDIRNATMHPFIHFLKYGIKEQWRKRASVHDAKILARFEEGPLADMVKEAIALDPMVALPMDRRQITSPFTYNHPKLLVAEKLSAALRDKTYEHAVLIPHIRMSGATRIAGYFTSALAEIHGADNVIVLMTDASHWEHPEWFPPNVELFPLYEYLETIGPKQTAQRAELLYDVLRGINSKAIYNVNSWLFWETLRLFGRQLTQEFELTNYFFCWEETKTGEKVGYPIQWLRDTINYQQYILTDSEFLANDISTRFGIHDDSGTKVIALRTPLSESMSDIDRVDFDPDKFQFKGKSKRVNAVWAGRFDRQKRLDVLVDVANANPDIDFWVFGKPVLENKGLSEFSPPKNIKEHKPFDHFDQLLPLNADFFLYTAQWDGMPTILLDAAKINLPVVAPDIGGVSEVINDKTGWLVSDHEDVDGYSMAIKELLTNTAEATKRAKALKKKVASERKPQNYIDAVKEVYT